MNNFFKIYNKLIYILSGIIIGLIISIFVILYIN